MTSVIMDVSRRHIQNFSEATAVTHHWGYADRMVPCTNDAGSCEYLDVVYHSHDVGMLYTGIIWATIIGIFFIWAIYSYSLPRANENLRGINDEEARTATIGSFARLRATIASHTRRYLLPEFARPIFGRTTRLQVLVLATLTGYLAIFTFAGIVYNTWITPVKKFPGTYNTRTSLGPFANRVGVIAYALTPLSILLSSRESLLSLITGLPYQSFNFLHRWLGYIIVIQAIVHTIGWSVIELRLYQPQPSVGIEWIKQLYMIWGVVAMFFLFALFLLSTPWAIRRTGYEFFRKSHYILAMLYIGACIGHWKQLSAFLIPALVVWFIDRAIRLIRTGLLHYNYINGSSSMGFRSTEANITHFQDSVNGDIVRLDFDHPQETWDIGQHFYLCFPRLGLWQSHPFTPLSLPITRNGTVQHSYIFRAKSGMTKKVADLARLDTPSTTSEKPGSHPVQLPMTSVILAGPYGVSEVTSLTPSTNILCIAGGTGITYVLPVLLSQISGNCFCSSTRKMQLIWAIRRKSDMDWIKDELNSLYKAAKAVELKISIFVTREGNDEDGKSSASASDSSSDLDGEKEKNGHVQVTQESVASSSSTSSSEIADLKNTAGGCCASKPTSTTSTNLTPTIPKDLQICTPPHPRNPSITVERRGSLTTSPPELRHPDLAHLVSEFVDQTVQGSTTVFASGPGGMISDLRGIVGSLNDGGKVWKGDERGAVELRCDDRLEW